jgi:hypothetical protein
MTIMVQLAVNIAVFDNCQVSLLEIKISILKRVDSILVPRGVCRLLIGCTVIVKNVRYDYDMTVLWI